MEKIKCENCGISVTRNNYKNHYLSNKCVNPKPIYTQEVSCDLKCIFCDKEHSSSTSVKNHQLRCNKNPQRIKITKNLNGNGGKNQYTKAKELGLPKPVLSEETIEKKRIASTGRRHTQETKDRISNIRKKYLEENPEKIPYLLNHSSKVSYPEKYFIECFKDLNNIRFQYRVGRYSLDFANIDKKVYFEVDGETHYKNLKTMEIDSRRTKFLSEKGWKEYRVRWKNFQQMSFLDKKIFVENIIEKLS